MVVAHDAPWRKIMQNVAAIKKLRARVGVIGAPAAEQEDGVTIADIAMFHEFGTATVPERSFIRRTFYAHAQAAMRTLCARLSKQVVEGQVDAHRAVGLLGAWGAAQVKNTITQTDIPPPLKPATIAAKGSTKPLVDTGRLLNAISWDLTEAE
jgi:hypothetical protein